MNDIETTVRARLHQMIADLPTGDGVARAQEAKARHRRQRRTRLGMAALTTAVIAIVAAPVAFGSLATAPPPSGEQVAGPGVERAEPTDTLAEDIAAQQAALEAARQAAAIAEEAQARGRADLAAAAARDQQYGTVMHDCLARLGIDTQVIGDGLTYTAPAGQDAAYADAMADCRSRTGYGSDVRLSEDAYRVLYADYLDVSQCLTSEGFSAVGPGDPDEFVATGGRSWNPYSGLSASETGSAQLACPLPTY